MNVLVTGYNPILRRGMQGCGALLGGQQIGGSAETTDCLRSTSITATAGFLQLWDG